MTKKCQKSHSLGCGRTLDISLFSKNRNSVQAYCKSCVSIHQAVKKAAKKAQVPTKADIAREMCQKNN